MNTPFTVQSVSKPLTYGIVLDDLSPDVVHQYVGHEPSGVAFNSIGLNYKGKIEYRVLKYFKVHYLIYFKHSKIQTKRFYYDVVPPKEAKE